MSLRSYLPVVLPFLVLCLGSPPGLRSQNVTSLLWGSDGSTWSPEGRLPDFSFAGYRRGEAPLPEPPVTHNVKDFGAVGDGLADDTEAFRRAIAAVEKGVILIPAGRYVISDILEIRKPQLVLRGEARHTTTLYFPKTLTDVRPNWGATTTGQRTSNYSWSGGFVWVRGDLQSARLAGIVAPAARGAHRLTVADASGLRVGQDVDVRQQDDAADTLARHLYTEEPGDISNLRSRTRTSLVARIAALDGNTVTLDRPLRTDLRPEWQPALHRFAPTVTEVGVENLTFEYPVTDYLGHFTELGYNAIAFTNVAHSWVRDIRLVNADSGIFVSGRFCTVDGVIYESVRKPDPARKSTGHHGITLGDGDHLFTRFDFRTEFQHDITMGAAASGNVVASGRGVDLCFDHHRRAPYENLFTDIDVGAGTHPWRCGGGAGLGLHAGARTTFWNIRAARPVAHPGPRFGPWSLNLVGLTTNEASSTEPSGRWFETMPPAELYPRNLYEAQRERRRGER